MLSSFQILEKTLTFLWLLLLKLTWTRAELPPHRKQDLIWACFVSTIIHAIIFPVKIQNEIIFTPVLKVCDWKLQNGNYLLYFMLTNFYYPSLKYRCDWSLIWWFEFNYFLIYIIWINEQIVRESTCIVFFLKTITENPMYVGV